MSKLIIFDMDMSKFDIIDIYLELF